MTRAGLHELSWAIDAAVAYADIGSVDVQEAVDLACDYGGIPDDRDRRIVRKVALRRLRDSAGIERKRAHV